MDKIAKILDIDNAKLTEAVEIYDATQNQLFKEKAEQPKEYSVIGKMVITKSYRVSIMAKNQQEADAIGRQRIQQAIIDDIANNDLVVNLDCSPVRVI